jgi:hypothetical protein
MCSLRPEEIVDRWFGPGPFRQLVANWPDVVWAGVAGLRREASRGADPDLLALLRRAETHARSIPSPHSEAMPDVPVVCPRLNIAGQTIRTISSVMRFDTAVDVTASELRIELMVPADEESEAFFQTLSPAGSTPVRGGERTTSFSWPAAC